MVTDFNTRVLTLKPEVENLCSSKSIRHTKVEILRLKSCIRHTKEENLRLKSCFLGKKETKLTQIFERHFQLNYLVRVRDGFTLFCLRFVFVAQTASPRSSSARPAILFVNQERLEIKFPIGVVGQTQDGMVYQLYDVVLYC